MTSPYYTDDHVTIYHGDCMDLLPDTFGYDLVVTSPPYNLAGAPWPHLGHWKAGDTAGGKTKWRSGADASGGVVYAEHEDSMPHDQYVAWQHEVLSALWRGLLSNGAIFYNHKPRVVGERCWTPLELIPPGLVLRQIITWSRAGGVNYSPTAYVPTYEWIMVLAKPDFRLKSKGASGLGDVWRMPQESGTEHPAPFPLALPANAIETCAPTLVLDPFMGSGTTLRAAKDAGVRAIGFEKSERYCEIAANRMAQEVLFAGSSVSNPNYVEGGQ